MRSMTSRLLLVLAGLLACALIPAAAQAATPVGTAFTYQGRLQQSGSPASGAYDLKFSLYGAATGGSAIGLPLTQNAVAVTGGLFTVTLDFGAAAFDGTAHWLEIAVKPAGSTSYTTLAPRQPLTPAPYAVQAASVPWSGVTGMPAGFADGVDNDTQYYAGPGLTLTNLLGLNTFNVKYAGNGTSPTAARGDHTHWSQSWSGPDLGLSIATTTYTVINPLTMLVQNLAPSGNAIMALLSNNSSHGYMQVPTAIAAYNYLPADKYNHLGYGLYAQTSEPGTIAVYGRSPSTAISGEATETNGTGVKGVANSGSWGYGVWGVSTSGYAGYFSGNVMVTGQLSKSSGSFKIDHPLDPAHKYLSHSFVESPDMKNLYDGIATLDAKGEAAVTLPAWFQALNQDFRYQLTCVGGYAPVYIAAEVANNQFKIAGGRSGMKVSWQVTGTRKDAWARDHRIQVEAVKPAAEQGSYLYPEGFGQKPALGVDKVRAEKLKTSAQ